VSCGAIHNNLIQFLFVVRDRFVRIIPLGGQEELGRDLALCGLDDKIMQLTGPLC